MASTALNPVAAVLRRAAEDLDALGQRWALVGGLAVSARAEPRVTERAERLEVLPTLIVPVATVSDLLALKVLARDDRRRPQDWDDIRALLAEATPVDIDRAKAALRLIEQRGYHRGKRLVDSFDEILQDHR